MVKRTGRENLNVRAGVLFRKGDSWHAFRVDGYVEQVVVESGPSNGFETAAVDGISEEDDLVLHPSPAIQTGTKVRIGE